MVLLLAVCVMSGTNLEPYQIPRRALQQQDQSKRVWGGGVQGFVNRLHYTTMWFNQTTLLTACVS